MGQSLGHMVTLVLTPEAELRKEMCLKGGSKKNNKKKKDFFFLAA